ncbi:type II CRISPR RNA-guided endonuclease Cas9 [Porphyrobacter sp. CACIAM 03H1]|uniref:type II CRISPR RNA-guided endonuclease Cas9 n=1 Tax=Porphyrobacter sp. CACIAM 03H1 TaxID=2003315 RepID=UPI000B5A62D3|nr:type II CRISPR RNA-guided endonuclease Cas9 [Porphyrobacter sp. CACIAM 03H1]ASJ91142.1 type II CRISPR RNA-guided endonuclease Cas9 [Porphyrobacter sp. CACIAM 03H1]
MPSELVFGFDIGTTSIGSAIIRMDSTAEAGEVLHLGVRIFPEARDPDGIPLNQERRKRRMMRRQLRRRRTRRRDLNQFLFEAGLLPEFSKKAESAWAEVMALNPWMLRAKATREHLSPLELGRALYHLAQRRHFRGRDLEDAAAADEDNCEAASAEEQRAASQREKDRSALKASGLTLGAYIAAIPERIERRRGHHFAREDVVAEFRAIIAAQAPHCAKLRDADFVTALEQTIFNQKSVFWRKSTLGECRFVPRAGLAASASWVAQEKRMLEKLNNLRIEESNDRPLDDRERAALLALLRKKDSVSWGGIRRHLKLYWRKHDLPEKPTFNLERGGEKGLVGNRLESRLASIMGDRWDADAAYRDRIRREIHARLYAADYDQIGDRIVIRREAERRKARAAERERLMADFGLSAEQAESLTALTFAPGWEPFSEDALWKFLPRLQEGAVFGALLASPEEEGWRASTFPNRLQPTGSWVDRLPTPGNSREEINRQKAVRNPTVLRVQNELRKVVNNLIAVYGRPDRIRVEVAREVGKSARERAEDLKRNRDREKERKKASEELQKCGIAHPSRDDIEKWLLWQECNRQCPYTGQMIDFAALFHRGEFQVEHIWPRWRSLDDSFVNKTLCHRDFNLKKANRTPFEVFEHDPDGWEAALERVRGFAGPKGRVTIKARRFAAREIPADFAARQLTDTGYAARQAVGFLKMLFPDLGQASEVRVATLSGRVTSRLRHSWGLNGILSDSGEKARADHRHHAIDALVVALAHPGYTQRLSRWFQARDSATPQPEPRLDPPFANVRHQAERKVAEIVVSHRVRRKVSGSLHKDTTYGDAGPVDGTGGIAYRWFVTRKPLEALTKSLLADDDAWPDAHVRDRVRAWIEAHGGDPKKAYVNGYPTVSEGGAPIRKVRIRLKQQQKLMARLKNGHADLGNNHHMAVFRHAGGRVETEIVSLFEAAHRLRKHTPVIRKSLNEAPLVMSLAQGDTLSFPDGKLQGLWIVHGVWAGGQIVLWRAEDATGSSVFRPTAASILKSGGRKVSVDPIGRIRPARD